jgi:hypothetical protein
MEDKKLYKYCEKTVREFLSKTNLNVPEEDIKSIAVLSYDLCSKHPEWKEKHIRYLVYKNLFANMKKNTEDNDIDKNLHVSDVLQRLTQLQRWQTSIHPPYSSKQEDGQWVRWEDIQKILSNYDNQ